MRILLEKGAGIYTTLIDVIEERNNYDYHRITFMPILTHVLLTDPNKKDEDGWNALHWVCNTSSDVNITKVVELLIERYYIILLYNIMYFHLQHISYHRVYVKIIIINAC